MASHPCTIAHVASAFQSLDTVTLPHCPWATFDSSDPIELSAVEHRPLKSPAEMLESLPIRPHSRQNKQNSQHPLFERREFEVSHVKWLADARMNCRETLASVNLLWSKTLTVVDCRRHHIQMWPHRSSRPYDLVVWHWNLVELRA